MANAELTWGLVIAAMRRIPQRMASLQARRWQESVGESLGGKTLGLFGFRRIAQVAAGYAKVFEIPVLVWAREESRSRPAAPGLEVASDRGELFERTDLLSVHLRLLTSTRGMVTAGDLNRMHATSLFVNTSRAGLVEPDALVDALRRGARVWPQSTYSTRNRCETQTTRLRSSTTSSAPRPSATSPVVSGSCNSATSSTRSSAIRRAYLPT
jgi:phosphoglycerate dehydrogenase-like enzyme